MPLERDLVRGLGQNVGMVEGSVNLHNTGSPLNLSVSHVMVFNVDVFRTTMMNRVGDQVDRALIVLKNLGRTPGRMFHEVHNAAQVVDLSATFTQSNIFSFAAAERYRALQAAMPRNGRTIKEDNVSSSRFALNRVIGPVSISVSTQGTARRVSPIFEK